MAATPLIPQYEQRELRRYEQVEVGRVYITRYNLPPEHATALPTRGEPMEGETGLLASRFLKAVAGATVGDGLIAYDIHWLQPEAYSGTGTNYQELRGSRSVHETETQVIAERIGVATDRTHADVPDDGDLYPSETGLLAKRAVSTTVIDEFRMPGLVFLRTRYVGYKAYNQTDAAQVNYQEVAGSRTISETDSQVAAERLGVCTDPTHADVPTDADVYPGDSGLLGKRATANTLLDPWSLTPAGAGGLVLVRTRYIAPKIYDSSDVSANTYQEIVGSRATRQTATHSFATKLGIASATTDFPSKGDLFPGDTNSLLGRKAIGTQSDEFGNTGLLLARTRYLAHRLLV